MVNARRINNPFITSLLWLALLVKLVTPLIFSLPLPQPPVVAEFSRTDSRLTDIENQPGDKIQRTLQAEKVDPEITSPIPTLKDLRSPSLEEQESTLEAEVTIPDPVEEVSTNDEISIAKTEAGSPEIIPTTINTVEAIAIETDESTAESTSYGLPKLGQLIAAYQFWIGLWACISLCFLVLMLRRGWQFSRLVREAAQCSDALQERTEFLARRMNLKQAPRVLIVEGAISPMIWPFGRNASVLFPRHLLESLSETKQDLVLTHELAHLKRKDHLLRWLELVVVALYWWLPTVRYIRRELHIAQEKCCDALVLQLFPEQAVDYGETLLTAAELLITPSPAPLLATEFGRPNNLRMRIETMLKPDRLSPLPHWKRYLLLFGIGLLLVVSLHWTQADMPEEPHISVQPAPHSRSAREGQFDASDLFAQTARPDRSDRGRVHVIRNSSQTPANMKPIIDPFLTLLDSEDPESRLQALEILEPYVLDIRSTGDESEYAQSVWAKYVEVAKQDLVDTDMQKLLTLMHEVDRQAHRELFLNILLSKRVTENLEVLETNYARLVNNGGFSEHIAQLEQVLDTTVKELARKNPGDSEELTDPWSYILEIYLENWKALTSYFWDFDKDVDINRTKLEERIHDITSNKNARSVDPQTSADPRGRIIYRYYYLKMISSLINNSTNLQHSLIQTAGAATEPVPTTAYSELVEKLVASTPGQIEELKTLLESSSEDIRNATMNALKNSIRRSTEARRKAEELRKREQAVSVRYEDRVRRRAISGLESKLQAMREAAENNNNQIESQATENVKPTQALEKATHGNITPPQQRAYSVEELNNLKVAEDQGALAEASGPQKAVSVEDLAEVEAEAQPEGDRFDQEQVIKTLEKLAKSDNPDVKQHAEIQLNRLKPDRFNEDIMSAMKQVVSDDPEQQFAGIIKLVQFFVPENQTGVNWPYIVADNFSKLKESEQIRFVKTILNFSDSRNWTIGELLEFSPALKGKGYIFLSESGEELNPEDNRDVQVAEIKARQGESTFSFTPLNFTQGKILISLRSLVGLTENGLKIIVDEALMEQEEQRTSQPAIALLRSEDTYKYFKNRSSTSLSSTPTENLYRALLINDHKIQLLILELINSQSSLF
ncbi:MAG: M56 family metallopeptidase [Planctomycetaceae bacterium]